jgi:ABC-2 type transport system ATP-binding protein
VPSWTVRAFSLALLGAGAQVVRAEGHRRWIRFARDQVSAADLVAGVLAEHQVLDLSIVEPDIEDVIRRIYRGERGH